MDKKKIAVLYIVTGKYFIFWDEFYKTAKQYLFAGNEYQVQYFVFTDVERELGADVKVTLVNNEHWPYPTLKRYHYFLQLESTLQTFDYVYFFNGNTTFLRPMDKEILPQGNADFAFVQQPFTLTQSNTEFGYERRPESKAAIKIGEGEYYIWGAFNGGKADAFIKMAYQIKEWTCVDLENNIIAAFWDESFLNKYLLHLSPNNYTLVSNDLFLVDGYSKENTESQSIYIMEKSKFFDVSFKNELTVSQRIKSKIKSLFN